MVNSHAARTGLKAPLIMAPPASAFMTPAGHILFTGKRFCKPKVGSSILSAGTSHVDHDLPTLLNAPERFARSRVR